MAARVRAAPRSMPAGARRAAQPTALEPMLATRVPNAPDGDGWLHEVKLDGYRLLGFFRRGGVRLLTRNGHDWTHLFGPVARAFADRLKKPAVLDGEVVVLNHRGLSDFHALQAALDGSGPKNLVFMAFDLPWHDGFDLSAVPLEERKALLERLLGDDQSGSLRYSAHIIGDGPKAQAAAAKAGLEGSCLSAWAARTGAAGPSTG